MEICLPSKFLPILTAIFSVAVTTTSIWTLVGSWNVDCPSQIEDGEPLPISSSIWNQTQTLTKLLRACCGVSTCATLLQLLVSAVVIFSASEKLKSRLGTWQGLMMVVVGMEVASILPPFTYDIETDTFLGTYSFITDTQWRLEEIQQLVLEPSSWDLGAIFELLKEDYNLFFFSLCVNTAACTLFVLMNCFCCCGCCLPEPEHEKALRMTRKRSRQEQKEVLPASSIPSYGWAI